MPHDDPQEDGRFQGGTEWACNRSRVGPVLDTVHFDREETSMRGRWLSVVVLAAVLLLPGCASPTAASGGSATSSAAASIVAPASTSGDSSDLIYGLVADSDNKGLVASYIGGGCDGPARLAVTETPSRIDVSVLIGPDPNGTGSCSAAGYSRTVAARLAQPIGDRTIFSGSHQQVPFDGSRKLLPSPLPANFTQSNERSGSEPGSDPGLSSAAASGPNGGQDAVNVTTRWSVTYTQPQPASDRCAPTRGVVQINLGPANADDFASGWSATETVSVVGHPVRLWRQGSTSAPSGWAYVWKADQGSVEVVAQTGCEGDRILTPTELLKVAQSLRSS